MVEISKWEKTLVIRLKKYFKPPETLMWNLCVLHITNVKYGSFNQEKYRYWVIESKKHISISNFFSCPGKRELFFHCANPPTQRHMIKMVRSSGLQAQHGKKNLKLKVNYHSFKLWLSLKIKPSMAFVLCWNQKSTFPLTVFTFAFK